MKKRSALLHNALPALAMLVLCAPVLGAQQVTRLWHDPGDVSKADLAGSVGSGIPAPKPPYTFIKEDMGGTWPKVLVRDANGLIWSAKFGYEVKPECFTWRIPVALGYFVEPSYYIPSGRIIGLGPLKRQNEWVLPDGHFRDARFQIRDPNLKYIDDQTWKWADNPFAGSRELKGLEILIMLVSNWDNKDGTSGPNESNTGLFRHIVDGRDPEMLYSFTDWGSGMGYWGDHASLWNCHDYSMESKDFIKALDGGQVVFGYDGHHNDDFKMNIHPSDVRWLMQYLGKITEAQWGAALRAAGATAPEAACFTRAIEARIDQLRSVAHAPDLAHR